MSSRPILYGERRKRTWPWWLGSLLVAAVLAVVFFQMGPGIWARTTTTGDVSWNAGSCLTLARWEGLGWSDVGTASYERAYLGIWADPGDRTACRATGPVTGSVTLPEDSEAGTYRICDAAGSCRVVRYTP